MSPPLFSPQVVGDNPDLLYPITLGGATCRVSDMAGCVTADPSAEVLATVCCSELLDPDSPGPEETISSLAAFGYVVVIPGKSSNTARKTPLGEAGAGAERQGATESTRGGGGGGFRGTYVWYVRRKAWKTSGWMCELTSGEGE